MIAGLDYHVSGCQQVVLPEPLLQKVCEDRKYNLGLAYSLSEDSHSLLIRAGVLRQV